MFSALAYLRSHSPERTLVIATLFAAALVIACRWITKLIGSDPAELDGFIFLTAIYWVYSVVGYFSITSTRQRIGAATPARRAVRRGAAISRALVRSGN